MGCKHRFKSHKRKSTKWIKAAYTDYSVHKQTYRELAEKYHHTSKTIRKKFDENNFLTGEIITEESPLNIIFDGTFFGFGYGILVFRTPGRNLYWREIKSESIREIDESLDALDAICEAGYQSFTIDGRRGVRQLLLRRYPEVPIQFCQFHQKQIVERYTTKNPRTACGKALKELIKDLTISHEISFCTRYKVLSILFSPFLRERNENNQFMHRRLRSAFRSLKTNLPYLFTFKKFSDKNIPNTTNSCEGSFSHWKAKIKLHRGISHKRRTKMIHFLLSS